MTKSLSADRQANDKTMFNVQFQMLDLTLGFWNYFDICYLSFDIGLD